MNRKLKKGFSHIGLMVLITGVVTFVSCIMCESAETRNELFKLAQTTPGKESTEPYIERLRSFEKEGKYDEAIIEAEKALKIDPKDERIYSALKATYTLAGKYNEALKVSDQLIELAKSKGFNICGYITSHAAILEYAGRQEEAIIFLQGHHEICPDYVDELVERLQKAKLKGERYFPSLNHTKK